MAALERVLDDAALNLNREEFGRVIEWFIGRYKGEDGPSSQTLGTEK